MAPYVCPHTGRQFPSFTAWCNHQRKKEKKAAKGWRRHIPNQEEIDLQIAQMEMVKRRRKEEAATESRKKEREEERRRREEEAERRRQQEEEERRRQEEEATRRHDEMRRQQELRVGMRCGRIEVIELEASDLESCSP